MGTSVQIYICSDYLILNNLFVHLKISHVDEIIKATFLCLYKINLGERTRNYIYNINVYICNYVTNHPSHHRGQVWPRNTD